MRVHPVDGGSEGVADGSVVGDTDAAGVGEGIGSADGAGDSLVRGLGDGTTIAVDGVTGELSQPMARIASSAMIATGPW